MKIFNEEVLNSIDEKKFLSKTPFPWLNEKNLLNFDAFKELSDTPIDIDLFDKQYGIVRDFGQKSHDRYELIFKKNLFTKLPSIWQDFLNELFSLNYISFIKRILGIDEFSIKFHWHYATGGGDLSPHTDSPKKIASHLFYMNNHKNWDNRWGGHTMVLDDDNLLDWKTAPKLEDFRSVKKVNILENYSLLFKRTDHSWHALDEIQCPSDMYRRVFTVIIYPALNIKSRLKSSFNKLRNKDSGIYCV